MTDCRVVVRIGEWDRQDAKFAERKERGKRQIKRALCLACPPCPLSNLGVLAVPFPGPPPGIAHNSAIHHKPTLNRPDRDADVTREDLQSALGATARF